MNTVTDRDVIRAMELHGGAFASHLAIAATYADDANLARIKQAFPELWDVYRADAERMQAQQAQQVRS
jgi:hypothetical protein